MKKLRATPPLMLLMKDINNLEHDAASQYKFNRFWAILWSLVMVGVPFIPELRHPLLSLLIMEASLWANFATHFGAMSAALAAMNTSQTVQHAAGAIDDLSDDIEDIHDVTVDHALPEFHVS
jgi:hypothetical protein